MKKEKHPKLPRGVETRDVVDSAEDYCAKYRSSMAISTVRISL